MKLLPWLLGLLIGVITLPAQAQLQWQSEEVTVRAEVGDREAKAVFTFENTGTDPVRIKSVETSCGCTDAATDKKEYAPGEHGVLTATMRIERPGQKTSVIIVKTDAAAVPVTRLLAVVATPEVVRLDPPLIHWSAWDRKPQTITIDVVYAKTCRITGARSSNPMLRVELETVEASKRYRLVLTPTGGEESFSCTVDLLTDVRVGKGLLTIPIPASVE